MVWGILWTTPSQCQPVFLITGRANHQNDSTTVIKALENNTRGFLWLLPGLQMYILAELCIAISLLYSINLLKPSFLYRTPTRILHFNAMESWLHQYGSHTGRCRWVMLQHLLGWSSLYFGMQCLPVPLAWEFIYSEISFPAQLTFDVVLIKPPESEPNSESWLQGIKHYGRGWSSSSGGISENWLTTTG